MKASEFYFWLDKTTELLEQIKEEEEKSWKP